MLFDRDGDAANTGTGFGKPAKDLSINFVPVPTRTTPAIIEMKPEEQQLWRVVNASGITYLNLEVLFGRTPQPLGLVAIDGVPLNANGLASDFVDTQTHLGVPPGARVEFIVKGPPAGVSALLVTKTVNTGPSGENDPIARRHNRGFQRCTGTILGALRDASAATSFRRCRGLEAWLRSPSSQALFLRKTS